MARRTADVPQAFMMVLHSHGWHTHAHSTGCWRIADRMRENGVPIEHGRWSHPLHVRIPQPKWQVHGRRNYHLAIAAAFLLLAPDVVGDVVLLSRGVVALSQQATRRTSTLLLPARDGGTVSAEGDGDWSRLKLKTGMLRLLRICGMPRFDFSGSCRKCLRVCPIDSLMIRTH